MARKDYIDKITQNLEHLTKDELKDVATLTNVQFGVRLKVAEKEYWEKEVEAIKSKLQQQDLPVVPECVGEWIEDLKNKGYGPLKNPGTYGEAISDLSDESLEKILTWISQHQEEFMRAWLDGYTVEKPQLFYLKHIDMSKADKECDYFAQIRNDRFEHESVQNNTLPGVEVVGVRFTQAEIDSMQIGSYEQIPVPVEDGE